MALTRRLSPAQRRLLLALFACAMLVRALVPAGWMPSPGGGLMPCDGMAPSVHLAAAAGPSMHHHGGHKAPSPAQTQSGDHPCAFAGPVAAVDTPQLSPAPPAAVQRGENVAPPRVAVAIGRGLAAPPPPPTGPPAFA